MWNSCGWRSIEGSLAPDDLFCRPDCVETWLARTGHEQGYVMDLPTLWRLAAHRYNGRLDYGYTRREPAATDYLRAVGLSGPFWGL